MASEKQKYYNPNRLEIQTFSFTKLQRKNSLLVTKKSSEVPTAKTHK
jgi:hypothetical protein